MKVLNNNIDIKESVLRRTGILLDIISIDCTSKKNIIWATDSYENLGKHYAPTQRIKPELVTGLYGKIIQPRAAKSLLEQRRRTKDKAEVFTPLKVVDQINKAVDISNGNNLINSKNWEEYVRELKLEITCGEGPFIVSRYNPTAHTRSLIKLENRVGFLDKKLKVVSKYCKKKKEWLYWAKIAFKASYGYEWQGDNVLLARENLLYTFIDYFQYQFNQKPSLKIQEEIAEIISWNIFQMDGLRYVIPMSCHFENKNLPVQQVLFGESPSRVSKQDCKGCVYNKSSEHNGIYVKIKDWKNNKVLKFVDLL